MRCPQNLETVAPKKMEVNKPPKNKVKEKPVARDKPKEKPKSLPLEEPIIRYFVCFYCTSGNGPSSFSNRVITVKRELKTERDIRCIEKLFLKEFPLVNSIRLVNFIKMEG
jgi:hypothetical protein